MEKVPFGKTGLEVSRLGVGLSEIGHQLSASDTRRAGDVLNRALDAGVNFLDTAACYGVAEELLGKTVASRRKEYVLATKAGHATADYTGPSWTYETVAHSIDRSLKRMRTDYIDIVQLHSCGVDVLEKGDVIRALEDARDSGKIRFVSYSGDNEAAHWAVESGRFASLQTSFNLVEQQALTTGLLKKANEHGLGIIVKRPIANGAWGAKSSPSGYASQYFQRAKEMAADGAVDGDPGDRILLALGFTFAHDEVDVAIVGTQNADHMVANIAMVKSRLPIDTRAVDDLHRRFASRGRDWRQLT